MKFSQDMYRIFRRDRCTETHPIDLSNPKKFRKNGGGVLIAVSSQLSIQSNVIPLKHEAEMLAIEIILKNKTIIIATCYRVGTLGTRNADEILKALRMLSRKKSVKKFIMVGDFNLPQINWVSGTGTSTLGNIFLNGFAESGMVQCIQESTHKKGSILDILLSRSSEHIKNFNIVSDKAYLNSDHYPITFDIMIKCKRRTLEKRSMYNYSRADWPNMLLKLSNVTWEMVLDKLEPDIAWETFKKLLFSIIDKYVPKIKVKTEFRSPWFDSECLQKSKEKEKLHKKFKDNSNLKNELKSKTCRREFKNLIKTKMRANLCDPNRNQLTKKFWSQVKSSSKSTRIPDTVFLKGKASSDSKTKADMFNTFFYSQFSRASKYDIDIDFNLDESFEIDLNMGKVKDILSNIDGNKAQGPDNIHGIVLKKCAEALAKPLSIMFKLVYNTGIILTEWKLANVVPVFKKDDKENVENYRPISLTCICGKEMERIMYDELYCRTINLIDNRQHGFLRNKSCVINMNTLVESISTTVMENLPTDIIYFDFAKAFDTVDHDLILNKLKFQYHIDARMLKFFKNYLSNRSQRVVLDNCNSDIISVLSGVPQGSILGRLLFVLFINGIYENIDEDSNINQYADDTKLWRKIAT